MGAWLGGFQDLEPDVYGTIPVVDGRSPVFWTIRIYLVALYIKMRFTRRGVVCVFFGIGKLHIEQYKLLTVFCWLADVTRETKPSNKSANFFMGINIADKIST